MCLALFVYEMGVSLGYKSKSCTFRPLLYISTVNNVLWNYETFWLCVCLRTKVLIRGYKCSNGNVYKFVKKEGNSLKHFKWEMVKRNDDLFVMCTGLQNFVSYGGYVCNKDSNMTELYVSYIEQWRYIGIKFLLYGSLYFQRKKLQA